MKTILFLTACMAAILTFIAITELAGWRRASFARMLAILSAASVLASAAGMLMLTGFGLLF